ncbi:hypothetical protein [Paraburkholderia sp. J63]|nr:hypothetical protein [Paraburkholderia sp. J63]
MRLVQPQKVAESRVHLRVLPFDLEADRLIGSEHIDLPFDVAS